MSGELYWVIATAAALWIYYDVTKNKIGYVPEEKRFTNATPGLWALTTLVLWIVALPVYLMNRKQLIERANLRPQEPSKMRSLVLLTLAVLFVVSVSSLIGGSGGSESTTQTSSNPATENPQPPRTTETPYTSSQSRALINPDLFGNLAFGMSPSDVQNLGGFYAKGPAVEYSQGKPFSLTRYATMLDEYVKIDIYFNGPGGTVGGVVLQVQICDQAVVKPDGMRLSVECLDAIDKFARVLTSRYGTPRQIRIDNPQGGQHTDKKIWPNPNFEVSFQTTTGVDENGYTATLFPMFVFEKKQE
jgi:hypothetical protein